MLSRILSAMAIAFRQVRRNKLRAGLTIIGIMIGIAAVVTMIALGRAARSSVANQVASLGSNALIIFPKSPRASGVKGSTGSRLNEPDCDALVRESTSVQMCAPIM